MKEKHNQCAELQAFQSEPKCENVQRKIHQQNSLLNKKACFTKILKQKEKKSPTAKIASI